MFPSPIERTIKRVCNDRMVQNYMKANEISGNLYQCYKISVYGTVYGRNQYIILPGSTNCEVQFGKIIELLSNNDCAYFKYEKLTCQYCPDTG